MAFTIDQVRFNILTPNEHNLGVPFIGGAVQVGLHEVPEEIKRPLRVVIESSLVTLHMADGKPFQIEGVDHDETLSTARTPMLVSPVSELALEATEPYGTWNLLRRDGVGVADPVRLKEFFDLVASFAVKKEFGENGLEIIEYAA